MEVRIVSSSLFIWRGRVCLGLVLQVFSANSINAYCKIMQVFWNCGSAMHALVKSFVSLINTGWGFVLSLLSVNEVFSSRIFCLPGMCAGLLIVVNFLFDKAIVLTRVLALLSCGVSYQSSDLDVASSDETSVFITLEFGGSMPRVLTRVLRWCTRGALWMAAGAVGVAYVWITFESTFWFWLVFSLKISANFASAVACRVGYSIFYSLILCTYLTRDCAILSICVSWGTWQCWG